MRTLNLPSSRPSWPGSSNHALFHPRIKSPRRQVYGLNNKPPQHINSKPLPNHGNPDLMSFFLIVLCINLPSKIWWFELFFLAFVPIPLDCPQIRWTSLSWVRFAVPSYYFWFTVRSAWDAYSISFVLQMQNRQIQFSFRLIPKTDPKRTMDSPETKQQAKNFFGCCKSEEFNSA